MYLCTLVGIDGIVGAHQSAIGDDLRGTELLFLQQGIPRALLVAAVKGGYLHEVEGDVTQLELLAPLFYQQLQALRILIAWVADVRAALIEQDALDGIVQDGVEGTVAPYQRTMVVPLLFEVDNAHRVRRLLSVLLQVLLGQPALYARTALVGFDESDGNVQGLVHHLGKEVARC